MPITVKDPASGKPEKEYDRFVEVDEFTPAGQPTGRKVKVCNVGADRARYQEREVWKDRRLAELETEEYDQLDASGQPTGKKLVVERVEVLRGAYDEVIGLSWVTKEKPMP